MTVSMRNPVLRPVLSIVFAAALWAVTAESAAAQVWVGSNTPRRGSWEIGAGAAWSAGFDLGDRAAQLTRNPGTGTGLFDQFATSSRVTSTIGGQARAGVYLSRSLAVEGGVQYLRPRLSIRVSGDSEQADDVTVSETMSRYVFDGSLVLRLDGLTFAGGRAVPFVLGGGGYVRELHARNELIETGTEVHAGAGVRIWLGRGARRLGRGARRLGLRADVGVTRRNGGFDFSDGSRMLPTAGGTLIYLF